MLLLYIIELLPFVIFLLFYIQFQAYEYLLWVILNKLFHVSDPQISHHETGLDIHVVFIILK